MLAEVPHHSSFGGLMVIIGTGQSLFEMATEAIIDLTPLQLIFFALLLTIMCAWALAAGAIIGYAKGRKATEQEVLDAATLVALEENPTSQFYGTYQEIGYGFMNNEGGTLGITNTSRVVARVYAKAKNAKRRKTQESTDIPM
jgi:hypothetical protein